MGTGDLVYCVDLGRMTYGPALDLQHRVVEARQAGRLPDTLLLVEHEPVITLGRRAQPENILVPPETLARAGIELHEVERGGDVTYHGPGQLVGYPILHLHERNLGAADYMHRLEDVLIATLADFGLAGTRREGIIGVWLGRDKVAALGVRIAKGVSFHGFALNISTDLRHFSLIVPCGIRDGGVTSMERALGRPVPWQGVMASVQAHFGEIFHARLQPMSHADLEAMLGVPSPQSWIEAGGREAWRPAGDQDRSRLPLGQSKLGPAAVDSRQPPGMMMPPHEVQQRRGWWARARSWWWGRG